MMSDVQTWLIARLAGDHALQADLGHPARIYDVVPAGRTLPCVMVRRVEGTDWSTDDRPGQAVVATLDIWSRAQNRAELHRITDRMAEVLVTADPVAGATRIILVAPLTQTFSHMPDQDAFFGQLRFRLLCEPRAD